VYGTVRYAFFFMGIAGAWVARHSKIGKSQVKRIMEMIKLVFCVGGEI
jgi:hypothetical protein